MEEFSSGNKNLIDQAKSETGGNITQVAGFVFLAIVALFYFFAEMQAGSKQAEILDNQEGVIRKKMINSPNLEQAKKNLSIFNPCGERVELSWPLVSDSTQYNVYRSRQARAGSFSLSDYDQIAQLSGTSNSYTDAPSVGASYSYVISSMNNGQEAEPLYSGIAFNEICKPAIIGVMTILTVNDIAYINQNIHNDDQVKIRLTFGNTGSATASNVHIEHSVIKNMSYLPGTAVGSAPNNVLPEGGYNPVVWNESRDLGDKTTDGKNWHIDFQARVYSHSLQPVDTFADKTVIYYDGGSAVVNGGPWLLRTGKARIPYR